LPGSAQNSVPKWWNYIVFEICFFCFYWNGSYCPNSKGPQLSLHLPEAQFDWLCVWPHIQIEDIRHIVTQQLTAALDSGYKENHRGLGLGEECSFVTHCLLICALLYTNFVNINALGWVSEISTPYCESLVCYIFSKINLLMQFCSKAPNPSPG